MLQRLEENNAENESLWCCSEVLRRLRPAKSIISNNQDMAEAKLPEEILMIILVRLPVNCLLRLRCVCKSWRSLIKDPYFIQKHLNYVTSMENEYERAILYFSDWTGDTTTFKCMGIHKKDEEGGDNNTPIVLSVKDVDFPTQLKPYNATIRACCDGILCISVNHDCVILWNPSIKTHKILSSTRQSDYIYGIGYDSSMDDYKVVRAPSRRIFENYSQSSVEVFVLKSNSWKTIQDNFPYEIENCDLPTFNNGCIHWVAKRTITKETVIVNFDVVAEKFGEVPLPHSEDVNRSIDLLLFGGNLRLVQCHGCQVELWVMKVYGVRESWTKLLTIPLWRQLGGFHLPLMPFCFTRAGIILLKEGTNEFVMYNLSDQTFKDFTVDNFGKVFRVIQHVESLVSPIR